MQGKVEDSQKWIQEKVLKIQDLEGKLTLQEIKNGEIKANKKRTDNNIKADRDRNFRSSNTNHTANA